MAEIETIRRNSEDIFVVCNVTEQEAKIIGSSKNVLVLPKEFKEVLTTGKLGNSNRIMMPKKILRKYEINMKGRVSAQIFEIKNKKFLLIEMDEKKLGIPNFRE